MNGRWRTASLQTIIQSLNVASASAIPQAIYETCHAMRATHLRIPPLTAPNPQMWPHLQMQIAIARIKNAATRTSIKTPFLLTALPVMQTLTSSMQVPVAEVPKFSPITRNETA
jgi:hypothetical protein